MYSSRQRRSPILQRGTSTSQNADPAREGTDLHCNPRKAVDSQPGFLNKNQNPTLHFRLLKAASAGEVFLCALAPPLPIPATTPRECARPLRLLRRGQQRGTRAAPPLPAWLLSRRPARSWQGPTLRGPLRFQLATSPQYLQFAGKHAAGRGGSALPTHKTGGLAVVLPEVPQGHLLLRPHLPTSP